MSVRRCPIGDSGPFGRPASSFHSARKTVDLDWVTFRDFRHFRASQWVTSGIDIKTVSGVDGPLRHSYNDAVFALCFEACDAKHYRGSADRGWTLVSRPNRRHLEEG